RRRSDLWPGNDRTRGYNALKSILGELYDLKIRYFVEVNFDGFKKLVDAVGGVTINVQVPVSDDEFPGTDGRTQRLYIPSGLQHMDGDQALRYARSRHTSTHFDRGARPPRALPAPRPAPRRGPPPAARLALAPPADGSAGAHPEAARPRRRLEVDRPDGHPGE